MIDSRKFAGQVVALTKREKFLIHNGLRIDTIPYFTTNWNRLELFSYTFSKKVYLVTNNCNVDPGNNN